MSVGAGLLSILDVPVRASQWIGYQVIFGFGLGLCFQSPNLAAQTVLPAQDVAIGSSLIFFTQILGGAIMIPVGNSVLNNQLIERFSGLSGFHPGLVTSGGATSLITSLPSDVHGEALVRYNDALHSVFQVGLIVSCLSVIGASSLEWKSVLKKKLPREQAIGFSGKTEEDNTSP